jgi:hypothetical protein
MLRLILAVVTVLIVAASLTSSEVRAAGNKTSASNKASTVKPGTGVNQGFNVRGTHFKKSQIRMRR